MLLFLYNYFLFLRYELWLGSDCGQFHVFNINSMKLHGVYSHYNNNNNSNDLVTIVKGTLKDGLYLWSYIYPSNFLEFILIN